MLEDFPGEAAFWWAEGGRGRGRRLKHKYKFTASLGKSALKQEAGHCPSKLLLGMGLSISLFCVTLPCSLWSVMDVDHSPRNKQRRRGVREGARPAAEVFGTVTTLPSISSLDTK